MKTNTTILASAQQRAKKVVLPYQGALLPLEAYTLLQQPGTQLVDVRSNAELDWVGRIPGAIEVELRCYPGMQPNPCFIEQLSGKAKKDCVVMFICRSGSRSNHAATLASQAGFSNCYNIIEGFEGDKDKSGHRGSISGWKAAGLPWMQS